MCLRFGSICPPPAKLAAGPQARARPGLSSPREKLQAAAAAQALLIRGTRWRTPENTFASSGSGKRQAPPGSPSLASLTAATFLGGEEKKGKPRRTSRGTSRLGFFSNPIHCLSGDSHGSQLAPPSHYRQK